MFIYNTKNEDSLSVFGNYFEDSLHKEYELPGLHKLCSFYAK